MKFYFLTSGDHKALDLNAKLIPHENLVVVINTLDDNYVIHATTYCEIHGIEYYVTESDGTPATGKNSVIDLFLASDNDYMVQIDGDDYITPHGVEVYKNLANHPRPPDMVVLYRQPAIKLFDYDWIIKNPKSPIPKEWGLKFPMDKSDVGYDRQTPEWLYRYFVNICEVDHDTASRWSVDRYEFNQAMIMYSEVREYMCRMVFYSRKCAEKVRFENNIIVGEDTIQFLKLKKMATEGQLRIYRRKERNLPTYLYYDGIRNSATHDTLQGGINWDWIRPFLNELDKIKDTLPHNVSLPEFIDKEWN